MPVQIRITDIRIWITDHRILITDHQIRITAQRIRMTDHRILITDHQSWMKKFDPCPNIWFLIWNYLCRVLFLNSKTIIIIPSCLDKINLSFCWLGKPQKKFFS